MVSGNRRRLSSGRVGRWPYIGHGLSR
jgi:hypothetical protein